MSYQEKSTWLSLIITVAVFSYYLFQIYPLFHTDPVDHGGLVKLFISMMLLYIVISIILHSLLALRGRKEAEAGGDERDRLIELKSFRTAYFVLAAGLFHLGIYAIFHQSLTATIHTALLIFVLSQIAGYVTQLYYYRRGV